jgi:hypothetical protein
LCLMQLVVLVSQLLRCLAAMPAAADERTCTTSSATAESCGETLPVHKLSGSLVPCYICRRHCCMSEPWNAVKHRAALHTWLLSPSLSGDSRAASLAPASPSMLALVGDRPPAAAAEECASRNACQQQQQQQHGPSAGRQKCYGHQVVVCHSKEDRQGSYAREEHAMGVALHMQWPRHAVVPQQLSSLHMHTTQHPFRMHHYLLNTYLACCAKAWILRQPRSSTDSKAAAATSTTRHASTHPSQCSNAAAAHAARSKARPRTASTPTLPAAAASSLIQVMHTK